MYKNYKIVVVTPSGRNRYQKILFEYIKQNLSIIDEYRLWVNTTNPEDLLWFYKISESYDWLKLDTISNLPKIGTSAAIHHFFKGCTEENTIYIRLDDDIVFLDKDFFKNLLDFRIQYPEYFLVSANIINNAICSHLHQRAGFLDYDKGVVGYDCMDKFGWASGEFAIFVHKTFLDNLQKNKNCIKYYFDRWIFNKYERFSINCISWFGSDMNLLGGNIAEDEESDITMNQPKKINKYNAICGNAVCSHFAFYTQRKLLDNTDLNFLYEQLIINMLDKRITETEKKETKNIFNLFGSYFKS